MHFDFSTAQVVKAFVEKEANCRSQAGGWGQDQALSSHGEGASLGRPEEMVGLGSSLGQQNPLNIQDIQMKKDELLSDIRRVEILEGTLRSLQKTRFQSQDNNICAQR